MMSLLSAAAAMPPPSCTQARPRPCMAGPRSLAAPWLVQAAKPARAAPQWQRRRPAVVCQAVEERVDLAKVADEPSVGLSTVFSPYTLAPLALGGGAAFALGYSSVEGIALGTTAGALARAAQVLLLESTVPFTRRRHTLLLPVSWELAFGAKVFQQQACGLCACYVCTVEPGLCRNKPCTELVTTERCVGAWTAVQEMSACLWARHLQWTHLSLVYQLPCYINSANCVIFTA